MKKQNTIFSLIFKVALLFLFAPTFECVAVTKQAVLVDSNGVPLSHEVLLLLSSSSDKLQQLKTDRLKNIKPNKATKKGALSRKKNAYNPMLEKELLYYLKIGQIKEVTQLLKKGVKPVYKNHKGETPLGIAVVRGWASMVIALIENGADINQKGIKGVTLLHIASAHGLTDVAKVLVRMGLPSGKRTDKSWTPLHVAARYGHWKLVQYYIQQGVNPDIRNSDGNTALDLARHLHHTSIIKILSRVTSK